MIRFRGCDRSRVFVVLTDLRHLLIYQGEPRMDPARGWPMPGQRFRAVDGQRGYCAERFCAIAVQILGWDTLPTNIPTRVHLDA
jgi:hypothetical protein